jgi:hypothetical protein
MYELSDIRQAQLSLTSSGLGSNTEHPCNLTHWLTRTVLRGFLLRLDMQLQLYDRLLAALIFVGLHRGMI